MRQAFIFLLIIFTSSFGCISTQEHFTLIGSRTIQQGSRYGLYVDSSKLERDTTVIMRLSGQNNVMRRVSASDEHSQQEENQNVLEFNLNESHLTNDYKLSILSHRNGMCAYDEIPIFPVHKEYSVFIQMDKPFYKPNDTVKFRIAMIDENTRPYQPRSLDVKITDARDRTIREFPMSDNEVKMGIYENKFDLAYELKEGKWNLSVTVNGRSNEIIRKSFEVKKQIVPLINVNIESSSYLLHTDAKLRSVISAKYAFGKYAKGTAEVKMKVYDDDRIVKKSVTKNLNIDGETTVDFDIVKDLKIKPTDPDRVIQINVNFTNELTGEKFSKVKEISLKHKDSFNMRVYNPKTFTPGDHYEFYVSIKDIDGLPENSKAFPVTMRCDYINDDHEVIEPSFLNEGFAKFSWFVPDHVSGLRILVTYRDSSRTFEVRRGNDKKNENFEMSIITKEPSLSQVVRVELRSVNKISTVNYAVVGKLGLVEAGKFNCQSRESCKFSFMPNEKMLPEASLMVYYVNDNNDVVYDTTKVHFKEFSSNYLTIKAQSNNFSPGSNISLSIESSPNSLVALLGIDESLVHLKSGNDIDSIDVAKDLLTFGHTDFTFNHPNAKIIENSFVYHQNFQKTHPCSNAEIKMLNEDDDSHRNKRSIEGEYGTSIANEDDNDNEPRIRRDFREVFIFDTVTTDESSHARLSTHLPDKITTWMITGFAMNQDNGLALAEPVRITTEKQMFVKLNLPDSIKMGKMFKVEATVYNFITSQKLTHVEVTIEVFSDDAEQQIEFIENLNSRKPSVISQNEMTKSISILQNSAKSELFYIRALKSGDLKIQVKAKSSMASDVIEETLFVEEYIETTTPIPEIPRSKVNRDFFKFLLPNERDSIEDRFTKLGINMQVYKFLKERNLLTQGNNASGIFYISRGYQDILRNRNNNDGSFAFSYSTPTDRIWTTAHIVKLLKQIKDYGIVNVDDEYITRALEYLASKQDSNGGYEKQSKYQKPLKLQNVMLTAFVTTVFLENNDLTNGRYNDVINNGIAFLIENIQKADSNYATAISAYAFALANQNEMAGNLLASLNDKAIKEYNVKYWSNRGTRCMNIPNCVEITSYVLLAKTKLKKFKEAIPTENWLISKRNYYGKDDITDGTILSLNALAEIEKLTKIEVETTTARQKIAETTATNFEIVTQRTERTAYQTSPPHWTFQPPTYQWNTTTTYRPATNQWAEETTYRPPINQWAEETTYRPATNQLGERTTYRSKTPEKVFYPGYSRENTYGNNNIYTEANKRVFTTTTEIYAETEDKQVVTVNYDKIEDMDETVATEKNLSKTEKIDDDIDVRNSIDSESTTASSSDVLGKDCRLTTVKNVTENFNLDIYLVSSDEHEITMKICGKFIPDGHIQRRGVTIIEIQAPSGYIVDRNNNLYQQQLRDFSRIAISEEGAKASIYFNTFTTTEVCPTLKFMKLNEVHNGVRKFAEIYDYYNYDKYRARTFYSIECGARYGNQ